MKHSGTALNILITAGPTQEFLDPVRFISNPSTATIGYQIAEYARSQGHKVVLISGPTHLIPPKGVKTIKIVSARQMYCRTQQYRAWFDCMIGAAAVSDFRPARFLPEKVKKNRAVLLLRLARNPDVLHDIGSSKRNDQVVVGFALETENIFENATKKLKKKNIDFIVANRISHNNKPFGVGSKTVYLIDRQKKERYAGIDKEKLARIILDRALKICYSLEKGGKI